MKLQGFILINWAEMIHHVSYESLLRLNKHALVFIYTEMARLVEVRMEN